MRVNIQDFQAKYGSLIPEDIMALFTECYVNNQLEEWKMYFYIDTKKKEISMNGVDEGKYSVVQTKSYDYKIIDKNTMQLHDKSLSWMHVYKYKRIR